MYAGSLPGVVMVDRNLSATAGSGDCPLNGMLKKLIPAVFAAAASASTSAPAVVGRRRLMIDLNPIFFSSGTASGVVAPPQATVVSSWAKLDAPGTVGLVTCCAEAGRPNRAATTKTSEILASILELLQGKANHSSGRLRFLNEARYRRAALC